ncbi:hypothetical protein SARC_07813, partial [Sphaeroforma arctica JP610]
SLGGGGGSFGDEGEGRARLFFVAALMTSFGGLTSAIVSRTSICECVLFYWQ